MLYNVIVLNHVSGVNVATIKLSEEGISENDGILMAGIVKAIRDFLQELKFGKIQTFQTQEKKIIIGIDGDILVALICDESTNSEIYYPRIKYIASLFNNICDWDKWCGELDIFDEVKDSIKTIINLSDQEIIDYLHKSAEEILELFPEVNGFRIVHKSNILIEKFRINIEFELKSLFESDFFNVFEERKINIEDTISKLLNFSTENDSFIDYGRFSILSSRYLENSHIIFFLSGNLNPILDFNKIINKIKILEGINEYK